MVAGKPSTMVNLHEDFAEQNDDFNNNTEGTYDQNDIKWYRMGIYILTNINHHNMGESIDQFRGINMDLHFGNL